MRRSFPLLVLLYVTLDFANPLMPGAVTFAAGSFEVVQADRGARVGRADAALAHLGAPPPAWSLIERETAFARPAPVATLARGLARRAARRAPSRRRFSTPPPSSEDH